MWGFILWSVFMLGLGYGIRMRGITQLSKDAWILWAEIRDVLEDDEEQEQTTEQSSLDQSWSRRE